MAQRDNKKKVKTSLKEAFETVKQNYVQQMNMNRVEDNYYGMNGQLLCNDKQLNYYILDTILEDK